MWLEFWAEVDHRVESLVQYREKMTRTMTKITLCNVIATIHRHVCLGQATSLRPLKRPEASAMHPILPRNSNRISTAQAISRGVDSMLDAFVKPIWNYVYSVFGSNSEEGVRSSNRNKIRIINVFTAFCLALRCHYPQSPG